MRLLARIRKSLERDWWPTGRTRLYWEQGGTVSLSGEEACRITGKTRWRTARWLPIDEYRALLHQRVEDWRTGHA